MTSTAAQIIAGFEGFRSKPYWDVNAYRTGYGSDTITRADGSIVPVAQGMTVSQEDALRDLDRRINTEFAPSVVKAIGQDRYSALTPQQQAVLTSLAYNYGAGAWSKGLRPVAEAITSGAGLGDVASRIAALGSHNNGINAGRRAKEASIFSGGEVPGLLPAITGQQPASQPQGLLGAVTAETPPETLKLFGWDTGATEGDIQKLAGALEQPQMQPMQAPQIPRGQGFQRPTDSLARALEAFQMNKQRRA